MKVTSSSSLKDTIKKAVKAYIAIWLVVYTYKCTPHRWTSVERVVKETTWRFFYPFVIQFSSMAAVGGVLLPTLDADKLLPLESTPDVVYISQDTPVDVGYQTLMNANKFQDSIVVWKNFTAATMLGWSDTQYVEEHVNMDAQYTFLRNFSNVLSVPLPLEKAWHDLENLYLGFSYDFLQDNADTLYADLKNAVKSKGEDVFNIIPYDSSIHHAFLYKGKKYSTGMHQAPVGDWFFQLGNAKVWRFVHPRYTPYIRPITYDSTSLNSYYDFLPDDTRIPYVDVVSETGDLMYFPPHWWHHVQNLEDGIGIGIGFRPFDDAIGAVKGALFPWTTRYGALNTHRMGFVLGGIKRFLISKIHTLSTGSCLDQRSVVLCGLVESMNSYVPGWSWNKMSLKHTDLHIAGKCSEIPKDLLEWKADEL